MPHTLALRDHGAVQSAVVRTSLAGAAAGLLHALVPGPLSDALALFAVGLAAVPPRSLRSAALAAILACTAAAAFAMSAPLLIGAILVAALFLRDLPRPVAGQALGDGESESAGSGAGEGRQLVAGLAGVAAVAGGQFVAGGLLAGLLGDLPPALAWLCAGGAAGFVTGLGTVGREVVWQAVLPAPSSTAPLLATGPGCRVHTSDERLPLPPPQGTGTHAGGASSASLELRDLLDRAGAAHRLAQASLGDEAPDAVRAAARLVERIAAFAARWADLDRQLAGSDRAALVARREQLAERARAAVDDEVRGEYQRAAAALGQQVDDLDAIRGWQERSLARVHHHVAVLERLHLAALHRRSVATGRSGHELDGLVDELSTAGLELDGAAELLAELPPA